MLSMFVQAIFIVVDGSLLLMNDKFQYLSICFTVAGLEAWSLKQTLKSAGTSELTFSTSSYKAGAYPRGRLFFKMGTFCINHLKEFHGVSTICAAAWVTWTRRGLSKRQLHEDARHIRETGGRFRERTVLRICPKRHYRRSGRSARKYVLEWGMKKIWRKSLEWRKGSWRLEAIQERNAREAWWRQKQRTSNGRHNKTSYDRSGERNSSQSSKHEDDEKCQRVETFKSCQVMAHYASGAVLELRLQSVWPQNWWKYDEV